MQKACEDGLVSEEKITEAAARLFTTRYLLGLFDETEFDQLSYLEVESGEHLALAEKAAAESFVLLKNNGILPLKKEKLHTIGIIGPNADSRKALIGNYHGTASRYVTVQEGLRIISEIPCVFSPRWAVYLQRPGRRSGFCGRSPF